MATSEQRTEIPTSSTIVSFDLARRCANRPNPLSDEEITAIRALLLDVRTIVHRCPVARMALDEAK